MLLKCSAKGSIFNGSISMYFPTEVIYSQWRVHRVTSSSATCIRSSQSQCWFLPGRIIVYFGLHIHLFPPQLRRLVCLSLNNKCKLDIAFHSLIRGGCIVFWYEQRTLQNKTIIILNWLVAGSHTTSYYTIFSNNDVWGLLPAIISPW